MKLNVILLTGFSCCLPAAAVAYTNSFTLDMETIGAAGWTDPVNTGSTIFTGTSAPVDLPPYSPLPTDPSTGYNGSNWLALSGSGQANGLALAIYDGTAGGSTTDPTDFTITSDVFIAPTVADRYQTGLVGRWITARANLPFEFFYARGVTGQPDGYGIRGDSIAASYGIFGGLTETANRWVRMRITMLGTTAEVAVDRDKDGTYDNVQSGITVTTTAGKPGYFLVRNVLPAGTAVPTQSTYFDNFTYSPTASVSNWTIY